MALMTKNEDMIKCGECMLMFSV